MANKLSAATDLDVAAAVNRTVFIDTSLDTHLAMVLSDLDTVYHLKTKIENEHTLCFTNVGNIVVHALKVKRKGHLYHLSDSMFVKDAFDGANKNWFLSVDASVVKKKHDENQLVHNPDSHNLLTCRGLLCNTSANGVHLPLGASPEQGTSDPNKRREAPQKLVEQKSGASKHDIAEKRDKSVEEALQSNCAAKGKRKFDDEVGNQHLREESIDTGKDISKRQTISQHALGDKEKSENAALDCLTCKPVDDDHPLKNNLSNKKRKKKKKSKSVLDQAGGADPSSGRDVLKESNLITTGVDLKASGGESDKSSVPGQGKNGIKHYNIILSTEECVPSSEEEHKSDAPEEEGTSIATKLRNSKDHYSVEVEGNHPIVTENHDDLPMDIQVSGQDNIGNDQAAKAEEQGAVSKKMDYLETKSKKHDDLPMDIVVSGQKVVGSGLARRTEVQGALHDNPPLSIGVSGQENTGTGQDERAEEQGALSKRTGAAKMQSKKHDDLLLDIGVSGQENIGSGQAVRVEEQRSLSKKKDSLKMESKKHDDVSVKIVVSGQENIESDQAETAEERGALLKREDSLETQSKKLDLCRPVKTEVKAEAVNATGDLLGQNGTVQPADSSKKRKRTKKTKDLVGKVVTASVREHVEGSEINISVESLGDRSGEPPSSRARNEESISSRTNGKEELRSNAESTLLVKETGKVTGNAVKNMRQTSENQENMEDQVRKKSKKKQKSTAKNLPALQSEDRSVVHQISPPPADNKSQVVTSSDAKNKGKLKKTAVKDHINEGKTESESVGVQKELVPAQHSQSNSVLANSTEVQLNSLDHKYKGNAGEADRIDNPPASADQANKKIEKSMPDVVSSGGVLVDKKIGANKAAKTLKAENIEKPDIQSDRISSDIQNSVKSNKKQGIEGKPPAGKSSTISLQGSYLSKDKPDESAVQPKKNLRKASRNGAKAPTSDVSDKLNSTPKKTKTQNAVNVSGTNIHSGKTAGLATVSNSHMESSRKMISKDGATNKNQQGVDSHRMSIAKTASKGKIVKSLKPSKKLVATPGTIFKDDDSVETSEDEEVDDSDASTKAPSDYSESSSYSDGESNANFNSPRKGSYTSNGTKSGGRSTVKSCSSSAEHKTFDSILKSSSRFKKAKLTASQLQLEDDSQPAEFVPDSLPVE